MKYSFHVKGLQIGAEITNRCRTVTEPQRCLTF